MRTRTLIAAVAAIILVSCGGSDLVDDLEDGFSDVASEIGSVAADAASELDDVVDDDSEHQGEDRDPDALYGVEVCDALVPAIDGDTAGLDRYAAPEVLAELSDGSGGEPMSQEVDVYDGDGQCFITIGDLTWTLELAGDGHVGDTAVSISSSLGVDSDGEDVDGEVVGSEEDAIASAVAERRSNGELCDGGDIGSMGDRPDHEVHVLDGLTVVAAVCDTFAYQDIHELLGWDGVLYELEVEQWMDGVTTSPQVLGFPYVEDGMLVNLEKARGIGDCGLLQTWAPGDGDVLVLFEARERECDDEADYVEPTEWELVYAADV